MNFDVSFCNSCGGEMGGAENAGRENAGHENDGPSSRA